MKRSSGEARLDFEHQKFSELVKTITDCFSTSLDSKMIYEWWTRWAQFMSHDQGEKIKFKKWIFLIVKQSFFDCAARWEEELIDEKWERWMFGNWNSLAKRNSSNESRAQKTEVHVEHHYSLRPEHFWGVALQEEVTSSRQRSGSF